MEKTKYLDFSQNRIRFFQLRRRAPQGHPLINENSYHVPKNPLGSNLLMLTLLYPCVKKVTFRCCHLASDE